MKAETLYIILMYNLLKSIHTELSYDRYYAEKSLKNHQNLQP